MTAIILGPAHLDLTVYVGDKNFFTVAFFDEGSPADLTGAVITASARHLDTDPVSALEINCSNGSTSGRIIFGLDDEANMRMLLGGLSTWVGVWDAQVQMPGGGRPVTVLRGALRIMMDVTRIP